MTDIWYECACDGCGFQTNSSKMANGHEEINDDRGNLGHMMRKTEVKS